ncbi:MAG: hypothetical protein ACYDHY_15845 [Acidiferrobacterales bacterium]
MVIGNGLPEDQKKGYIRSRLTPGAVIYRHCDFTNPPKPKYLLVVNVRAETAVLLINSEIHQFIKSKPHLLACQVPIDYASHDFLDHDSFIDCRQAEYIDSAILVNELLRDLGGLRGRISDATRHKVINAIKGSPTMPQVEINTLVSSLSQS